MTSNLQIIKENTKYAATIEKEFEKSINLLPDENIECKKRGIVFKGGFTGIGILQSPGLVVSTNRRIIFLMHHFFSPDTLLYIPLNAILRVNLQTLGFLRGAQRAIQLEYDHESIMFGITQIQKFMSGSAGSKETVEFFELLKEKLPRGTVDETVIETSSWDFYLFLAGLLIGYTIGGASLSLLCAVLGALFGNVLNRSTR